MKRILLSIALFSSVYLSAQTLIVEEKYEEDNVPVSYKYLPNSESFIITKGKRIPRTLTHYVSSIFSYDENANKKIVLDNVKLVNCTYSITENTIKVYDGEKVSKPQVKYFSNSKFSDMISHKDIDVVNNYSFGVLDFENRLVNIIDRDPYKSFPNSFNDIYELGFTNQKNKKNIDFEDDDIYLETLELKSFSKNRVKLDKPDVSLLKGDNFIKSDRNIGFNARLVSNEQFDIITKSISNDHQTTILYKTSYGMNGAKIKSIPFKLSLKNSFFIVSDNLGGYFYYSAYWDRGDHHVNMDIEDLCVNNYYEDAANGDVYIYGLYNNNASKKFEKAVGASGYYIFKFDKEGNKIWESINSLEVVKGGFLVGSAKVRFVEVKDKLMLSISIDASGRDLVFYDIFEKNSGKSFKSNQVIYKEDRRVSTVLTPFVFDVNEIENVKNMYFSPNCFIAMDLNDSLSKYILSKKTDNKVFFETIFSKKGFWLIESDNKEYYKITFYKD